jgi:hypothetical protein
MRTLPASADQRNQNPYRIYSGADTDRLGSYGRAGNTWIAFDRLGKPIGGFFDSERSAIAAIEREASS